MSFVMDIIIETQFLHIHFFAFPFFSIYLMGILRDNSHVFCGAYKNP